MNGNGGADRLYGGIGGDTVSGGMGNDSLWGDAGADTLNAGTGRDYLMGGNGKDTLVGGTDAAGDVFKFNDWLDSTFGAVDRIVNFTRGADDIDMRTVDADENSESTNEAFHFSNRTADAHAIWWKPMQGGVLVQADVSGDGLAEMEIFVRGVQTLTASDFLL